MMAQVPSETQRESLPGCWHARWTGVRCSRASISGTLRPSTDPVFHDSILSACWLNHLCLATHQEGLDRQPGSLARYPHQVAARENLAMCHTSCTLMGS